jgi:hypothetical protein
MSKTDEERDLATLDKAIQLLEKTPEYQMLAEKLKPLAKPILSSSDRNKDFLDFLKQSFIRFKKSGERECDISRRIQKPSTIVNWIH